MRPANLDDRVPFPCFCSQHIAKPRERGNELFADAGRDGHVDRRRKHVIRALTHVDVVIRMDRLLHHETVAAQDFDGSIADHFVRIHVARCARAGLIHVDGKLIVEFSLRDFLGGGQERCDLLIVQPIFAGLRELAQVAVHDAGSQLDEAQCVNHLGGKSATGNWKILHSPLRLCPVIGPRRHPHVAHGVVLGSIFGHRQIPSQMSIADDNESLPGSHEDHELRFTAAKAPQIKRRQAELRRAND